MGEITDIGDGAIYVAGATRSLTYRPRAVTLDDGTTIAHESQGGTMSAVWATDLGDGFFVEVTHLGDGAVGGELVMSVTHTDSTGETTEFVTVGELWTAETPSHVPPSWPVAVDLALGLVGPRTTLLSPDLSKDELEAFHQRLLGALHG